MERVDGLGGAGHGKIDVERGNESIVPVNRESPIVIRAARADEAGALTVLCRAAKSHWGYPSEWLEAWAEALTVTPRDIFASRIRVGESDGVMIGFYGLREEEGRWHLEHLWIAPEFIGHGAGRTLFEAAVNEARRFGVKTLHIKADPNAEPFYLKMGALRRDTEVYSLLGHRRELPLLTYEISAGAGVP